jgi:hypothetical protein
MCTRVDLFYEWDRGSKFQNEGLKAKNDSSNLRSDGLNTMENNFITYSSSTTINFFGLQATFV